MPASKPHPALAALAVFFGAAFLLATTALSFVTWFGTDEDTTPFEAEADIALPPLVLPHDRSAAGTEVDAVARARRSVVLIAAGEARRWIEQHAPR